jgi:hypothetical protein
MSARSRLVKWAALAAEAGGALLLVLAAFWLFIVFLYAIFPSGTPLRELVESRRDPAPGRFQLKATAEATLSSLQRDVRFRRGNSIAWGGASEGMPLYSQDAVQTFDRSGARISFGGNDQLDLGSNSLVVVTRLEAKDEAGPKSYRVQVDGEVRGSLAAGRKLRMEFAAAGHLARMAQGAARFRFTRNGENGASLAVYSGEANVEGFGRSVRVPANFGVTLKNGVAVGAVLPLPAPPLLGESDRALYRYRLLPPRVRFTWSGAAESYHLQLSKDAAFKSRLIDERLAAPEFVTGKLSKGSYFWRVSRVVEGREGTFSRVGRCELAQVLKSPELQVGFPPERQPAGPFTLNGRAEPGSRVFVDGVEVASRENGSFEHSLQLNPGVNLIRVEALDAAGNASYASRVVYGKAQQKEPVPATW